MRDPIAANLLSAEDPPLDQSSEDTPAEPEPVNPVAAIPADDTEANQSLDQHTDMPVVHHQVPDDAVPGPSKYWSPKDVLPYPKACAKRTGKGTRKKGRTMTLTDTPVRNELAAAASTSKQKKPTKSQVKSAKRRLMTEDTTSRQKASSSESECPSDKEDMEFNDDTDSDDPKIDQFTVSEPTMNNINDGDFLKVCYTTKKTKQHFVGIVLTKDMEEFTVEVKYLTRQPMKSSFRFVYPEVDDTDVVDIDDIASLAGGTKRAAQQYIFDVDLSHYF
ncbi:hypothetical protein SNE40_006107 [Patella caerulea]|uniref:Uncharacterized protein n=1 Tax=Patella caerulea TaxID=87958 RepID=A0AAN8PZH7_PATCE